MKKQISLCVAVAATVVTFNPVDAHAAIAAFAPNPRGRFVQVQDHPNDLFRGVGFVTAINPATGSLTINHEDIPGLMSAMEMVFRVDPSTISNGVHPGDKIEFFVEGKAFIIRRLQIIGKDK